MPSNKVITPVLGGSYYHIFNRGINRSTIFFQERNYHYFLLLFNNFISEYVSVLAYCLLPNHFHLILKVKDELFLKKDRDSISKKKMESFQQEGGIPSLEKRWNPLQENDGILITDENEIGKFVSNQFRRLFITYTMAINKQEKRTGSLFDKNFKRLEITDNEYLKYAIFYVHFNPEKHGFVQSYNSYKFSSFSAFHQSRNSKIDTKFVFDIFDGNDAFLNYHSVMHNEKEAVIIE